MGGRGDEGVKKMKEKDDYDHRGENCLENQKINLDEATTSDQAQATLFLVGQTRESSALFNKKGWFPFKKRLKKKRHFYAIFFKSIPPRFFI